MATITSLTFAITSTYSGAGLRAARRDMDDFDNGLTGMSKAANNIQSQLTSVTNAVLAFGPALVPVVAASSAVAGGLAASGVAAGAAAGIFGGALFGAITKTVSAYKDSENKLKQQQKALAQLTPGTEAYEKQLKKVNEAQKVLNDTIASLTGPQRMFYNSIGDMTSAWAQFISATEKDTLTPTSIAMDAVSRNMMKFVPVVKAVSPLVTQVAKDFAHWMDGPGLDRFIQTIIKQGVPALRNFIGFGKSVIAILGQGFRDFLPFGNQVVAKLAEGAKNLQEWAAGGGFKRFLDYVHGIAPDVGQFFKALTQALVNIGGAAANLSGTSFSVLTVLLQTLALLPPDLLANLVRAWLAWNAALVVYNVVAGIAATVTTILAIASSGMGIIFLGMVATVATVIAVLAALAVGIYFLVDNWSTVSGFFVSLWNTVWGFIKDIALKVWDFLTNGWGQVCLFFMGPLGLVILVYKHWQEIWGAIQTAAQAVWDALKTGWSAFTGWLSGVWDAIWPHLLDAWHAFIDPLVNAWNTIWPQLQLAASNVWDAIKSKWDMLWAVVTVLWQAFWNAFGPVFTTAWQGLVDTALAVWDLLTAAWGLVWSVIQGIFQTGWALLSGAWSVGWTFLTQTAQIAWAILTGAWQVVWAVVRGIWDVFWAAFSGIFTTLWNTLVALVTGIWNVIKAAWDALWKTVTAIFMTFLAIFTGNWGAAWNSIKDAALAIWNVIKALWQTFLNTVSALLGGFIATAKAVWSAFWTAVQTVATTFWNALKNLFQVTLNAIQALWQSVWNAVKSFFQTLVNSIVSIAQAAWNAFKAAVNAFLTAVQAIWNTVWNAIKSFFNTIVTGLVASAKSLWDQIEKIFTTWSTWVRTTFWNPVRDFFTKTIPGAFSDATKAVGKAWDAIKKLVRDPIQAIVNVVYNNGIVKLWNAVAGVFGAKKLGTFTLPQFKEGGPTGSGSANGFPAIVHPGEHVWTSAEVKAMGGHKEVARLRAMALGRSPGSIRVMGGPNGRYDDGGGIFGTGIGPDVGPDLVPDGIVKNVIGKLKDVVLGGVYDVISGPIKAAVKAAQSAVRGIIPGNPMFEDLAVAIPQKIGDTILSWIKDKDVAPDYGNGKMVGAIPSGQHLAIINAALKAAGVPPPGTLAQWQKGLNTLITRESGWNPNAQNNWDSNAAAGMASRGLAQVIPPTFASNHVPGTSSNIFDPVANVAAAIRYITRRYGNITNVQQANANLPPKGYRLGTPGANRGWAWVGERGPERVRFRGGEKVDPLSSLVGSGRAGDIKVNVPININGRADHGVVDRLERETIPKLTMAIKQGVGRRS
jgi:phage-related protein